MRYAQKKKCKYVSVINSRVRQMRENSICTLKFQICTQKNCMEKDNENLSNLMSTYEEANRNLNNHVELLFRKQRK